MTRTTNATTKGEPKPAQLPATGFIRIASLVQFIPFSQASIWRKVREGRFPKPIKLSERVTAWRVEEVRAWIDAQGAGEGTP